MIAGLFILLMAAGATLGVFDNKDSNWKTAADFAIAFAIFALCLMVTAHA